MARKDGSLDDLELSLYNYEKTRGAVDIIFRKYRYYKEEIFITKNKFKSGLNFETTGILNNNISNTPLSTNIKLEKLQRYIDIIDEIINSNIDELNLEEKVVLNIVLKNGLCNDDLIYEMNRSTEYVYLRRKSCYIKIARWFSVEVYDDAQLVL